MRSALLILEVVGALGVVGATAYCVLCILGAVEYLQDRFLQPPVAYTPPVTILKPLKGMDPSAYEGFRSHCLQDYPEYEIVFGVSDESDPAVSEVRRLQAEFPERVIKLVVCPERLGTNGKVSTLVQMVPHARYRHLLVNDSDIRVPADYLREVMRPMHDGRVGLVTALYRGEAGDSLGSKLEALGIDIDFAGGVLAARKIENGLHFGLGATLALPRDVLEKVGGFAALLDHLADDYELGLRISRAGYLVSLANTVVDTSLSNYTLSDYFDHQLRWGRTIHDRRPGGYFGTLFTFGAPWAALTVLAARGAWWSWLFLIVGAAVRFAMACTFAGPVLRDRRIWRSLWLLPIRDFAAIAVWAATYLSDRIRWRGEVFRLKDGKLVRALQ